MELIQLRDIDFSWANGRQVLKGLDFSLCDGERMGVTGPNGAGKSTMFQIILGLVRPSAGSVRLFEKEVKSEKDFAPLRPQLGYCFQDADDQLFSPTVLEDVAFGPLNLGQSAREARQAARAALEEVGLAGFEERVTYNLSGGEKRLVSLATVLSMRPRLLLLDEPTTGLDEDSQERIEKVLLASGIPFAVISHDKVFLQKVCNKRVYMRQGRLLED